MTVSVWLSVFSLLFHVCNAGTQIVRVFLVALLWDFVISWYSSQVGGGMGLLILQEMLTNSLLLTAFEVTPFFFRVQICHIQSLVSKHCDLKRITSFYCFQKSSWKISNWHLKESTANAISFWEQGRESFCPKAINNFKEKKQWNPETKEDLAGHSPWGHRVESTR